jgi:3-oxoadipate enol-lactonase
LIVELNNFKMAYSDQGARMPLVFVHGYPLNRRIWQPQLEGLSGEVRVIAPDLRGHGESTATPPPYSMDSHADDLHSLLQKLELPLPIVLCGLSMGGYVSLAYIRRYPQDIAGLILTATRAAADSSEGRQNREKAIRLAEGQGAAAIADGMLAKLLAPGTYEANTRLVEETYQIMLQTSLAGIVGDLMGMKDRPDSTPLLEHIHQPVLIIHGADDQIIPVAEARGMQAALPDAELVIIGEAGHLVNLEQPEQFNAAVTQWLHHTRLSRSAKDETDR